MKTLWVHSINKIVQEFIEYEQDDICCNNKIKTLCYAKKDSTMLKTAKCYNPNDKTNKFRNTFQYDENNLNYFRSLQENCDTAYILNDAGSLLDVEDRTNKIYHTFSDRTGYLRYKVFDDGVNHYRIDYNEKGRISKVEKSYKSGTNKRFYYLNGTLAKIVASSPKASRFYTTWNAEESKFSIFDLSKRTYANKNGDVIHEFPSLLRSIDEVEMFKFAVHFDSSALEMPDDLLFVGEEDNDLLT